MVTSTDLTSQVAGVPDAGLVERALAFVREAADGAKPAMLPTGETVLSHAEGMLRILDGLRVDDAARAAACLFAMAAFVPDTEPEIEPRFGEEVARLVKGVRQLLRIGAIAVSQTDVSESSKSEVAARQEQVEALRKMLLAFAQDIRVVLMRLASRLQTLRWLAQTKNMPLPGVARETLDIYAPLANPARDLADEVGAGGPPPSASNSRIPTSASQNCWTRSGSNARAISRRRSSGCSRNWPRPASPPRSPGAPSTSTASGRRCAARSSILPICTMCARSA